MGPIELQLRQYFQTNERERLDRFAERQSKSPTVFQEPRAPHKPPTEPEKPGIFAKGFETGIETAGGGIFHMMQGVKNFVNTYSDPRPLTSPGPVFGALGETALGAALILGALPLGVGAALGRAAEKFVPGLEGAAALAPEDAGVIRATLGSLMFLDPELRKKHDFYSLVAELSNEPMTYAEIIEILGSFVAPLGIRPVARYGTKVGVQRVAKSIESRIGGPFEFKIPSLEGAIVGEQPTQFTGLGSSAVFGGRPPNIITEPLHMAPPLSMYHQMIPEDLAAYFKTVTSELKQRKKSKPKPQLKEGEGKIIEGEGKVIETPEPKPTEPKTPVQQLNRDLATADAEADALIRKIIGELNVEERKLFGPEARSTEIRGITKDFSRKKDLLGEKGGVDPDVIKFLARSAIGAVIGGTQGETPEERIQYMLAGFGLGAFGPRLVKPLVDKLRRTSPSLFHTTNPVNPAFRPPAPTPIIKYPTSGDMTVQSFLGRSIEDSVRNPLTKEQWQQAAHIEIQAVQQVFDIAKKIKKGAPSVPGELVEAMTLARSMGVALGETIGPRRRRELGRGIEDKVLDAQKEIASVARRFPNIPETTLADIITSLPKHKQISLLSRLYFASGEFATQAVYGTMLSGLALTKNGIGNAIMLPLSAVDRSLASLRFWDPANRPPISQGAQGFVAFYEGVIDQYRLIRHAHDFKDVWQKLDEQAQRMGSTHMEISPHGAEALRDIAAESGHEFVAKGMQYLAHAANAGPGVLTRTDGMAKYIHRNMATRWEAMEWASKVEGLKSGSPAFWNRVNEISNDWSQLSIAAIDRIKEHADHMTFTRPFEPGSFWATLQSGFDDPWANFVYRMTVGTFVRTPIRLLEVGAEYTPGLNLLAKQFHIEMQAGGMRRAVAEARLATGLLTVTTFMYLAMNGLVTGSPPADPNEIKLLEAAGRPPLSAWDPLSQKWRSYKGIEPLTTLMATGANLANVVPRLSKNNDALTLILGAALAEVGGIDSNMYLQSISEVLDVLKNGRDDVRWGKSIEYIRRRMSMFNPAIMREVKKLTDAERVRVMADPKFDKDQSVMSTLRQEFDMLYQEVTRNIPGMPGSGKKDRNVITGDVMLNDSWPMNPFVMRPDQPTPWAAEIRRLHDKGVNTGIRRLSEWIGQHREYDIGLAEKPELPGIRLSGEVLDRWEVLMTQVVTNENGEKLAAALDTLVQTPMYKDQSDVTKGDMIHRIWYGFKIRARDALFEEMPDVRRRLENQRLRSQLERLPSDHPLRRQLEIIR